jgi:hypothetical protein
MNSANALAMLWRSLTTGRSVRALALVDKLRLAEYPALNRTQDELVFNREINDGGLLRADVIPAAWRQRSTPCQWLCRARDQS